MYVFCFRDIEDSEDCQDFEEFEDLAKFQRLRSSRGLSQDALTSDICVVITNVWGQVLKHYNFLEITEHTNNNTVSAQCVHTNDFCI